MQRHVDDALDRGASLVTGGARPSDRHLSGGYFYSPTVLEGVTPDMLVSTEETFGPVAAVARFMSEKEAIELANQTSYGLSAYFHTRDYARLFRVAERLEFGVIGANTGVVSAANAPFGGFKQSGYGREGGSAGVEEYLDTKYVLVGGLHD